MKNPTEDKKGSNRGLRGGYWLFYPLALRSAERGYLTPTYRNYTIGFRIVRNKQ